MLSMIQQKLKIPKGQVNAFGKYKYRSCEDILEAVKPLLGKCSLTLSDELIEIGGNVYVKAIATLDNGTKSWVTNGFAREPEIMKGMSPSQITGAASSYSRKYALCGLFCIDDTKDADTMDNTSKPKFVAQNTIVATSIEGNKKIIWAIIAKLTDGFKDTNSLVDIYKHLGVADGQVIKKEKDAEAVNLWVNNIKALQKNS